MMVVSTWLAAISLSLAVPGEYIDLFEAGEHYYTGGEYQDKLFRYRLFVPRSLKPKKRYPLIVWLHGLGESGSDNGIHLRQVLLMIDDPEHLEKFPFFLLAVQCPRSDPAWFHGGSEATGSGSSGKSGEMGSVTVEILRKVMREYPVDQDRVCLSGVSSGGGGCWEMAMRYPQLFAAVAPMSSGGGEVSRADRLVDIPIWAFHNRNDTATRPDGVQRMVAAVKEAGGERIHLTVVPGGGHDCWRVAFKEHEALGWMLAQRRGSLVWRVPPGSRPWKWWHVAPVPGAAVAVLVWLGWRTVRRRRQQVKLPDGRPRSQ